MITRMSAQSIDKTLHNIENIKDNVFPIDKKLVFSKILEQLDKTKYQEEEKVEQKEEEEQKNDKSKKPDQPSYLSTILNMVNSVFTLKTYTKPILEGTQKNTILNIKEEKYSPFNNYYASKYDYIKRKLEITYNTNKALSMNELLLKQKESYPRWRTRVFPKDVDISNKYNFAIDKIYILDSYIRNQMLIKQNIKKPNISKKPVITTTTNTTTSTTTSTTTNVTKLISTINKDEINKDEINKHLFNIDNESVLLNANIDIENNKKSIEKNKKDLEKQKSLISEDEFNRRELIIKDLEKILEEQEKLLEEEEQIAKRLEEEEKNQWY